MRDIYERVSIATKYRASDDRTTPEGFVVCLQHLKGDRLTEIGARRLVWRALEESKLFERIEQDLVDMLLKRVEVPNETP